MARQGLGALDDSIRKRKGSTFASREGEEEKKGSRAAVAQQWDTEADCG
jgi:hypothetical protein